MKVAIVGAGVTGLYLGWKLSEKGHEISIFEKKEGIGKKVCSGLFSERILEFIPESRHLIENRIDFVLIHFPQKTIKIRFSRQFLVMNHSQLDNLVAAFAQKTGVQFSFKKNISDLELNILKERFEKIIGCDGPNSIVRKNLSLPEPNYSLGIQGFIFKKDNSNYAETWPTQNGFLWKIPRKDKVEYGIMEKPKKAKKVFSEFLKEKGLFLERINPVEEFRQGFLKENLNSRSPVVKIGLASQMNICPISTTGRSESKFLYGVNSAIVPQGLIIPKNPKITLCGDAAGLTKPWSGGGVVWSLIAASLLLKNFPDFLKYKKAVEKFFLPKIIFSKMATKIIYFLGFKMPWLLPKEFEVESDFLI